MSNKVVMAEITDLLIKKLKDNVQLLQCKALTAAEANDSEACREALRAQSQEINTLIRMTESAARKFS